MIHPELRPLGIGEILDRAVTLFVQRFAVLLLVLAVVAIPVAIVQYIAQPQTTAMLADLQRLLAVPPGHTRESQAIITEVFAKRRLGQTGFLILALSGLLGTLSSTACVIAVAQAYRGTLPSVREVYREALRRWLSQLVAIAIFMGLATAIFIGITIVVFFIALAVGALAAVSTPAATVIGIPAVLVLLLVLFGVVALIYLTAGMSFVSIALEESNPFTGIAHGLRRTLSPPVFWRSLLTATIVLAVSTVGGFLLVAIAGAVSVLTHLAALYAVIAVIGGIAINALLITFITIYAIDIRVRREGYDLTVALRESAS